MIIWLLGGLAHLDQFKQALAILLQQKIFPGEPNRVVRMEDFGRAGRPTLKIVGANLSQRNLHLFSPERTPKVSVADAVAASICLPIIFAPWRIGEEAFIDGGIVSNLPAWPFDEERELDLDALTIAVEIADTSTASPIRRYNWLHSAVRTAAFGSSELNLRAFGSTERLVLDSNLNLLQFDLSLATACQEVRDAEVAASIQLDKRLFRDPQVYRDVCETARAFADDVIRVSSGDMSDRIRVAIALPDPDFHHSLRLRYSVGYEDDTDEGMLFPLDSSAAGAACHAKESRLEIAPFVGAAALLGPANRMRRKLQWQQLAWQLNIPILDCECDRPLECECEPRFLVHLDGNTVLQAGSSTDLAVTEIESLVREFVGMIKKELP
jgi:NTE family protein